MIKNIFLLLTLMLLSTASTAHAMEFPSLFPETFGDRALGISAAEYRKLTHWDERVAVPAPQKVPTYYHRGNYHLWDQVAQLFRRADCSFAKSSSKNGHFYYALMAWNGQYSAMIGRTNFPMNEKATEFAKGQLLAEARLYGYCK